jgi:histidine kinase
MNSKKSSYSIIEKIYDGVNTFIYKGYRDDDNTPVIIKSLKTEYPTGQQVSKLKYEYDMIKDLDIEGIIKYYDFTKVNNHQSIIIEDIQGESLDKIIEREGRLDIPFLLKISIKIAKALEELHKHNIIHKDIKTLNIIINKETEELRLIDFGISSQVTKESTLAPPETQLDGTLAYISPEQTGRTNQKVDYRSDLYSMGITFYELLTGELPFKSTDAMELVHAHIAITPDPPHKIREDTPPVLSEVIMKLLSKNADDRYQSTHGLILDLEECLKQYEEKGRIDNFQIASHDLSDKLKIPQKLYGREEEKAIIDSIYEKVCEGESNITFISGYTGIGKTSLAEELKYKTITNSKSIKADYFINGVYDRYRQNIPYHGLIDAIETLVKLILTEKENEIQKWKEKIISSFGSNGRVLTEVIPTLNHLVGEQPPVEELEPSEAQSRFNLVFQNFIKVFTDKPFIILLDDLQYIDIASINLIEKLVTDPEIKKLYVVGAYRENELAEEHPLSNLKNSLEQQGKQIDSINLKPLSKESIHNLITDAFFYKDNKAEPLTEVILNKTNGNPFFINHFLRSIYDDELLRFDMESESWVYDLDAIKNKSITDNVAQLMSDKIKALPEKQVRILKLASCIGITFDLRTLSFINDKSLSETAEELKPVIEKGLIVPMVDDYLYVDENSDISYKFLHQNVHTASYELNSKEEKQNNHLKIGRYMLNNIKEEEIENNIFDILNQLNAARELITDKDEIKRLIELNIKASEKSKTSSAFDVALEYSSIGMEKLPDDFWDNEYELTFNLYITHAASLDYTRKYDKAEDLYKEMLKKAKNDIDRLKIYQEYVGLESDREDYNRSLQISKLALKLFDINIPDDNEELEKLVKEEDKILREKINDRTPQQILELPPLDNKQIEEIMNMLRFVSSLGNKMANNNLEYFSVTKIMNLIMDYGIPKDSAGFFIYYSIYLKDIGEKDKAFEWGKTCIDLVEKGENAKVKAKVYSEFAGSINQIKNDKRDSFPLYKKAFQAYMDIGEISPSAVILGNTLIAKLTVSENLKDIFEELKDGLAFTRRFKIKMIEKLLTILYRVVANLLGLTENYYTFNGVIDGEDFNEENFAKMLYETNFHIGLIWLEDLKLKSLCIYEDFESIIQIVEEKLQKGEELNLPKKFYNFLALTALYNQFDDEKKKEKLPIIEDALKSWGEISKDKRNKNIALMDAEYAKINGDFKQACQYYEEAIKLSTETDYVMDVALSCEYAARFYNQQGMDFVAKAYYTEAYYAYRSWGADGKVEQMGGKYKDEINFRTETTTSATDAKATISLNPSGENMGGLLDISTVIKSSQTISGEIKLYKLLKKLMEIVIENAGAQKGYLILKQDDKLTIEAEGNIDKNEVKITKSQPVEGSGLVPESIINYVNRTGEDIVLKDASAEESYNKDPYIAKHKPKSVMSIPLINQGKLTGILYLENNIAIGVFTEDRLELLKMLSGQIAISIENSLLYNRLEEYNRTLEQKVEQRTIELKVALEEVTELKVQQDGDYFLTSLLIQPLIVNKAEGENVEADFYITQKKKFEFKEWNAELGGDICIAHSIILNHTDTSKEYTVFVNGDAMGKSIQGAGGALVLGVVFNALVNRTKFVPGASDIAPEEWLIRCFRELQDVFVSFDGSMLISVVVGIIDDATGMMYYFNAEHPWVVLYRQGKASFIERELLNHKIGWTLGMNKVEIRSFHLKPGDVIISGSDGRDDIYLDTETKDDYVINQDETLFLHSVEKAKADLKNVVKDIKANGELMDDLSLLKISYKKEHTDKRSTPIPQEYYQKREKAFKAYQENRMEEAIEKLHDALRINKSQECFKKLINSYLKVNDYVMALYIAEQALDVYPGDLDIIFQASVLYKRNQQFDKAIYYGKRYYIHKSKELKNLINLADAYRYNKNYNKAVKIIKEAKKIDPDNDKIKKLFNIINQHL